MKLESATDMSIDATLLQAPSDPTTQDPTQKYPDGTGGRLFIGGASTDIVRTINGEQRTVQYGQQVRIGGTGGQVLIYPANYRSGQSGVWEFLTDGIYYNGTKVVSV